MKISRHVLRDFYCYKVYKGSCFACKFVDVSMCPHGSSIDYNFNSNDIKDNKTLKDTLEELQLEDMLRNKTP